MNFLSEYIIPEKIFIGTYAVLMNSILQMVFVCNIIGYGLNTLVLTWE